MIWLYKSLENHSLSQKLSWLLSDKEHLLSCFEPTAFLCQEKYSEAVLICLRAVEENQLSLLTDIDPCLYLSKWKAQTKCHRRCSSFPDAMQRSAWVGMGAKARSKCQAPETEMVSISPVAAADTTNTVESTLTEKEEKACDNSDKPSEASDIKCSSDIVHVRLEKNWRSLPTLSDTNTENVVEKCFPVTHSQTVPLPRRSYTQPSSPAIPSSSRSSLKQISPSVLKIDYKQLQKENAAPPALKSSKQKNPSTGGEIIVLKDVVKSEPIPIQGSTVKSRSGAASDSLDSSTGSTETTGTIKQSDHKKEVPQQPRLLEVPHSVHEETDSSYIESNTAQQPEKKVKLKSGLVRSTDHHVRWRGIRPNRKKSFMEDGGSSVQPMSTAFFPRPTQGQSLSSFLASSQFAQFSAELDRENAHFSISEAIISAIEQVKCNQWLQAAEEAAEESDEEIIRLKQRIRLRRSQKQEEKRRTLWRNMALLSDGKTDTTTTDQSVSPLSSSSGETSDSLSTDDVDDLEVDQVTSGNLADMTEAGLSVSMASLYSEAEISRPCAAGSDSTLSAESVALALLRRFSDKHLPRASDIQWLVSEQDAPQQLLPLPKSWPVSPDAEDEDMQQATPLRGTRDWAPPRAQIIFTPHPPPVRRILMAKQNNRCAGCGMKVAVEYAHRFRYCEYLGRYFCTDCHTNQLSVIPGRVLHKWDFTRCAVSNFSYRLLDQMSSDPLFNIDALNPALYKKVHILEKTRQLRLQLFYIKDFLFTCRFAQELQECLRREPTYLLTEPEVYSLQDLIQVKSGELVNRLKLYMHNGLMHVANCQLCKARGFMCELCEAPDIIYPWQLMKVVRCSRCGACFHKACIVPQKPCPRCARISARTKQKDSNISN